MAAAAQRQLMQMSSALTPEMMPVLEQKSMKLEARVAAAEERVQLLNAEYRRAKTRLKQLQKEKNEMGEEGSHLRGVGGYAIFKEMLAHDRKRIRILEVDRDRAIKAHDKVKAHNEDVRRKINVLRKNAMLQDGHYKRLKEKLVVVRDLMAADLKEANDILVLHDECKETIEQLKEDDAQEEEDFRRECQGLSQYVQERLERLAFIEKGEDLTDLSKLTPQEQVQMENQLEFLSTSMQRKAAKDATDSSQLQDFQVAFGKLKKLTGITDIRKMVSSFIEVEDRNFGMFQYIQLVNKDAKREQAALERILGDIAAFEDANREAVESKKRALVRRQREAQQVLHENDAYQKKYRVLRAELERVRTAIRGTFNVVGCAQLAKRPATSSVTHARRRSATRIDEPRPETVPAGVARGRGGDGGAGAGSHDMFLPPHEVKELLTEKVSEVNILKFMASIEQRAEEVMNSMRAQLIAQHQEEEESEDGSVAEGAETMTSTLPAVVTQTPGPKEPAKSHYFHIVLPEIGDDDDDNIDLGASLHNPITNAMEASMAKLRLEHSGWDDVALASLLAPPPQDGEGDAAAAAAAATPKSRGTPTSRPRRRRGSNHSVTLVRIEDIAKEIDAQFKGPDGLAVSQFIRAGRSAKPESKGGKKGRSLRRKKRASTMQASRSAADLGRPHSAGNKSGGGIPTSKTMANLHRRNRKAARNNHSVRFSSTVR